jgi:hypothetical protein
MTSPDSILEGIKAYILTNATAIGLEANAALGVDFLGPDKVGYSIATMPGATRLTYVNGGSFRTFPFAFQASLQTEDDTTRVENGGFFEALSDWFDDQNEANSLPSLPTGKTAYSIEALDSGYLYQEGASGTGIYQILCELTYEQAA